MEVQNLDQEIIDLDDEGDEPPVLIPQLFKTDVEEDDDFEEVELPELSDESQLPPPQDEFPNLKVGLKDRAFEVLKVTADLNKKNTKPTVCALLIGEIKLAQKYERYKGKTFGYTEGCGKTPLNEPKKMASKAVVFLVISLNQDWKIPIGLFFVHNPDIKYFADTIEETLTRLQEIDINIISVTLNSVSPHLSFALAEELGVEILPPWENRVTAHFPHPVTSEPVQIFYDADIILAGLKNFWSSEKVIKYQNKQINYELCLKVNNIKEENLKHFQKEEIIYDWIIHKKRIQYDLTFIGRTMADAIQYLRDIKYEGLEDSGETVKFIKLLDLVSQISKGNGKPPYGRLSLSNEKEWIPLIGKIVSYIKHLKSVTEYYTPDHLSFINTYIRGLTVYFTSLLEVYKNHVKTKSNATLSDIIPSKFGLRHIRIGLFTNLPENTDMTALDIFKKMETFKEQLNILEDASNSVNNYKLINE